MKMVICPLLGLAALVPAVSFATDITAAQIVAKVTQTYSGLRSFRFVEHQEMSVHDARNSFHRRTARYEIDLAASIPGKIRLVVKSQGGEIWLVSDGRRTWQYIPNQNGYMETAGAPLLEELRTPPINLISDDLARNRSLTHEAERAKLRGEETLSPGGHNVRCYVVDVPPRAGGSHRLWVDEQRYIVLQDEWISPPGSQPDVVGPYRSYLVDSGDWISQLTEADLGPISNDVFQFVVPSGAADSFSVPSGFAQALETALACLLLGSTMEEYVQGPEWPLHVWDDPVLRTQYRLQGTKARDFTLGTLGGENVRLEASRGKIVVLDFWASWCEPCQGELAALQKLHDELGSQGVVFLGIDEESSQTIEDYVKAHGCTFPMLLDPEQTVHQLYGVRCVPTTVVIDRKGKIAAHYVGARGEAQLRRALKSAGLKTTP